MYHVEVFDAEDPVEMERLLAEEALPYWRRRGFGVWAFATVNALGPRQFWLVTKLERVSEMEEWPQRAAGEPEGAALFQRFVARMRDVRASLVREISPEE